MILKVNEVNHVVLATIMPQEASLTNSDLFKEEMITLVANGARLIILSFENVQYIDSSFLGSLVVALKYAIPRKVDIYLVALKPDVKSLLTLIRMDKVFNIYNNFSDAMKVIK